LFIEKWRPSLTSNVQSAHILLLRQLELKPLGVVVIRYDLRELQIDETLLSAREGFISRFSLGHRLCVFSRLGRVGFGFVGAQE